MIILYFIFVASLQGTTAIQQSMPVLLIDTEHILPDTVNINTNPFHLMSSDSFGDIVRSVEDSAECIVIFVEDGFSVEDISSKDAQGSPYVHIQQGFVENKISYIPKVEQPFSKLKQLFPPIDSNVFYLSKPVNTFDKFKYYYIFFNDTAHNESKVEKLRRHDSIMRSAYFSIRHQTRGPIFGIYTGKANPNVVMRATDTRPQKQLYTFDEKPRDMLIVTDGALLKLADVYSTQNGLRDAQAAPVVGAAEFTRRSTSTRLLYSDFELEFDFLYHDNGRWELKSVSLLEGGEEVGTTRMGVGAPYGFSYYCAEPLIITNRRDGSAVVVPEYQVEALQNIQVEPVQGEPGGEASGSSSTSSSSTSSSSTTTTEAAPSKRIKDRFTRSVVCSPCFPAGVLAALGVVGTMLAIALSGLSALFNCESNSRYDDANQKPLVITAHL